MGQPDIARKQADPLMRSTHPHAIRHRRANHKGAHSSMGFMKSESRQKPETDQQIGPVFPSALLVVVRKAGLEPARLAALEPKSSASTSSATFAQPGRALTAESGDLRNLLLCR
jgi:hypothetical protein